MSKEEKKEKQLSLLFLKSMLVNTLRVTNTVWAGSKKWIIWSLIITLVVSGVPYIQSGANALLINKLVKMAGNGSMDQTLLILLIIMSIATIMPTILRITENYLLKVVWYRLSEEFEIILMKKRGELDIAVHENPKYSDLLNKINEKGLWSINNFFDRMFFIMQNLIDVLIATIILLYAQWWLFGLVLLGTIPELWTEMKYGSQIWGIWGAQGETRRRFWDLKDHFYRQTPLTELKISNNTNYFLKLIKDLLGGFFAKELKIEKERWTRFLWSSILSQGVIAFAMVWLVYRVLDGQMQIGTMTFLIASIFSLRQALSSFFSNIAHQYQDNLFVNDVYEVLAVKDFVVKPEAGFKIKKDTVPKIEFQNVSFAYPETKKNILKNFSLTINPGEKIALIGVNGVGKTTIVKLLCRFYDPSKGKILIDGHDLKEIDLTSWYDHLGVLFQDYANYNFLVKEAIGVGRTDKNLQIKTVQNAAKAGEADVFIEEWEKSYDQMLGKRFSEGVEPSIGQWQKLALARTFYRDPKVLILDEPTSSIDAEAEAKIFERLNSITKQRSVILISHRFSTVRQANQIVVIKNGKIEELGTHEQLLKNKKTYSRLFNIQAKGYR